MAHTVNVNFKLDADVKKSMEQACSELGLSMSAAFTVFAKKVGREKRIPFEVSVDPFYKVKFNSNGHGQYASVTWINIMLWSIILIRIIFFSTGL